MSNDFLVVAANPGHILNANIAIAACRANGVGMIDIGYNRQGLEDALLRLQHLAKRGKTAIRIALHQDDHALPDFPYPFDFLVLATTDLSKAALILKEARTYASKVFLEVTTLEESLFAESKGFDGVLAKGHEAGGFVGTASSLILAQSLSLKLNIPFWLEGGISPNTAAAARVAGAAGVVFREALWGLAESPFSDEEKERWCALDGSQTALLGEKGHYFRAFSHAGTETLETIEMGVARGENLALAIENAFTTTLSIIPLGQEIAFAGAFAKHYGRVGCLVSETYSRIRTNIRQALAQKPFAMDAAFAKEHRTQYPFVQGPMTRVSDVPDFAKAVANGGGLPFLALALLRADEIRLLLEETKNQLKDQPWGVGILGFIPPELRQEQLEVVRQYKPPFAIIAGGRPSQAKELEEEGISTYLHVPSSGLLASFLKQGARNFIFEGRECGGHVGPRTSFVLWESVVQTILDSKIEDFDRLHLLFAGGIHDACSAAMVAAIATPLLEKKAKIGILMGTAYLFTKEAVESGAITKTFQQEVLTCTETALLESGPGHATRCARTPFVEEFEQLKKELILKGLPKEDIQRELEALNVGRLRIAAKGVDRDVHAKTRKLIPVDEETQHQRGMVMIGDVALIHDQVTNIAELHQNIAENHLQWLKKALLPEPIPPQAFFDEPIAIVGMAGMFPEAANIREYWHNILNQVNCIREVPQEIMDVSTFYDPNPKAWDKTYSRWGGFLKALAFDPAKYGIPPQVVPSIEPTFLIALEVARQALDDAGWLEYPFPRKKTAAIFGLGGMHELGMEYVFRTMLRQYLAKADDLPKDAKELVQNYLLDRLPEWTEDAFPGILGNVSAGRIANRLDLGGSNFTIDAACGTSLAALQAAIEQLKLGACDVALVGAMDGSTNVMGFVSFGKTRALSPRGQCRTFDDSADGIAISDGVAALVLKRLSDAERDGDKIYALIRGIGSSSDGRARSLTAPDEEGQKVAVRRAYEDAGITPTHVELVEAHGTGTKVGDRVEITALKAVFSESHYEPEYCAIGSVKSMIGHTKVAAGMASLIKCALALEHKLLPPTYGVEKPSTVIDFQNSPFYISAETRPWLTPHTPRRAGISAFGFGGTNFHVIIEEYRDAFLEKENLYPHPVELFLFRAPEKEAFYPLLDTLAKAAAIGAAMPFESLAYARWREHQKEKGCWRLAIIAENYMDLAVKIEQAKALLNGHKTFAANVFLGFAEKSPTLAFLFPGQGSQRINMLRDLVLANPSMHPVLQLADDTLRGTWPQPLSRFIYPLPAFNELDKEAAKIALQDTMVTQSALGAVELAAFDLLKSFGITPSMVAGHSYGEYTALCAAGVLSREDLFHVSLARGRFAKEVSEKNPMAMAAIQAGVSAVETEILKSGLPLRIANINSPLQTIVAGKKNIMGEALTLLEKNGLTVKKLAVSTAFHIPEMQEASEKLAAMLETIPFSPPHCPVFSNTLASVYPEDTPSIRHLLARHLVEPVRFAEEIDALYAQGASVFIEVGPGRILTNLIHRILEGKSYKAIPLENDDRPGLIQFAHLLGELYTLGVPVQFDRWFAHRGYRDNTLVAWLANAQKTANPPVTAWRLTPAKASPWHQPSTALGLKKEPISKTGDQAQKKLELPQAAEELPKVQEPLGVSQKPLTFQQENKKLDACRPSETRTRMDQHDFSESEHSTASKGLIEMVQSNLSQFIALQQGQQHLMERFLDMQERFFLNAQETGFIPPLVAPAPHAARPTSPPAFSYPGTPTPERKPRPAAPTNIAVTEMIKKRAESQNKVVPAPAVVGVPSASSKPTEAAAPLPTESKDDLETFKGNLLRLVAAKTGYPPEMLDLSANLEADLGVDSIKKIEIFGELREHHNALKAGDEEKVLEELSNLRTLNAILDWYQKNNSPQKKSLSA